MRARVLRLRVYSHPRVSEVEVLVRSVRAVADFCGFFAVVSRDSVRFRSC